MPRIARLDTPGLLHHVMIRGIERRKIFNDNEDRDNFIERMSKLLPETKTQCYAWSFLPNHAHFLFRSGPKGIAALMRRLLTGYVVTYNRRHKRHGQLFQNRYKSIVCQEDSYLLELVRYIHLNPLRAKRVNYLNELDNYSYSGHKSLMGKVKLEWQDTEYVLGYFGKTEGEARKKYRSYVEKGIELGRRPELVGGGLIRSLGGWDEVKKLKLKGKERIKSDQRILGESEFVSDILLESEDQFARKYKLKRLGYNFEKVMERVSDLIHLDKNYITGKGRQRDRVIARDLICYFSVNELGMAMVDLARRFDMTPAAVSCAVQRGEKWANENDYKLEI
ncbi:MAG TPA: transposase [Desulfobacteraceae bacterium]|nr:transposase [Desulfobacteraceae bacterium]HPQ27974.1 transposase [Desulfobacteraceae bacterium]